jgi:lipopolysaccharide export system protein LptA
VKITKLTASIFLICCFVACTSCFVRAQESKQTSGTNPIVVNGDRVEYSADNKEVNIAGNVLITYKGSRLTADKVKINTLTKDAVAEGNVVLQDDKGTIEAESLLYNFENKKGTMLKAKVKSGNQYGKGEEIDRVSDNQFEVKRGYLTTCDYDEPHFRIFSKKIDITTGDKITSHNDLLYIGKTPIIYLPEYTHSLKKDPFTHFQFRPGYSKDWGPYLLTSYRDDLNDYAKLRLFLDYRIKTGPAEGFGLNYDTLVAGKGDFKFYYTNENDKNDKNLPAGSPTDFERYLIRWRHAWNIDPKTTLTSEYYKISDEKRDIDPTVSFLKDYFKREYDQDVRPKSYVFVTHTFQEGVASVLLQPRINRWYTETEKLPELSYDLSTVRLGDSPFYFTDQSKISNLAYKTPVPSDRNHSVTRIDTLNQFSLPSKVSFLWVTPFVGSRETYYSKDRDDHPLGVRTAFTTGTEVSTKFYRIFNVKSDLLGLDINGLRHVITPVIRYSYIHAPTIPSYKLHPAFFTADEENEFFDAIDNVQATDDFNIEVTNKLQTKRKNETVDLAMFRVLTDYRLHDDALGSRFSDIYLETVLTPYSWLRLDADGTYGYRQGYYKTANADIRFNFTKDRYFGIGERYERKGPRDLVSSFVWRINPKWKLSVYERFQLYSGTTPKGLAEQQYSISRDLHCWTMDFTYDYEKTHGHSFWMVFRLNAFPQIELGFDAHYNNPTATTTGK